MEPSLSSPILRFTNVKLSTIQPLQKRDHVDTIEATLMDSLNQDIYFPILFVYKQAVKSEALYSQQVKRIKESLQQVLISLFPYAGRWIPDPVVSSKRKLLCNDDGVPFIEAYLDRDLDSVVDVSASFQPVPELQGFGFLGLDGTQFKQRMPPGGVPCMFAQITRFKCGGVTFAVTYNHTVTDGTGFVKFLQAWREAWLGFSRITQTDKSMKVDHDRPQIEASSLKTFFSDPQSDGTAPCNGTDGAAPPLQRKTWAMKVFEVEVSTIESIKRRATDKRGGRYVSTVDCIAAHLWKSLAGLPSSMISGRDVSVVTTVEGRDRFYATPQPNMASNVISFLQSPKIPTNELREMPLASIARKLRETLQTTKREEWLDSEKFDTFTSNKSASMQITSWLKFPVYTLDWGWGKPVLCTLNTFMYFNDDRLGKVYITPPLHNSSSSIATVQLFCRPDVLQALEHNPTFQAFFIEHNVQAATNGF